MAYPIHPSEGFLRVPSKYPHDAFGVDTGGRVRPHSGFDATPRVKDCPARSVLGGEVVQTGYTIYAGHYVVEAAPDGWLWLSLHLARLFVGAGHVTRPDTIIGVVGNTGGGGGSPLTGNAKMGKHIHVSRCRDMSAVERIINGRVRARYKGESSDQWAAAHGLSDPYPHIIASIKSADKQKAPVVPATTTEVTDMAFVPDLFINKSPSGPKNIGIAVFGDGHVRPLPKSEWDAWGMYGARQREVKVSGHWSFIQDQARALRERLNVKQTIDEKAVVAIAAELREATGGNLADIVADVLEAQGVTLAAGEAERIAKKVNDDASERLRS